MSKDNSKMRKTRIDDIDRHVSSRLRARRIMLGLSQQALGDEACVSVQQIQKYEKANNRISSGKLYHFANFLNVSVTYFFDDIDSGTKAYNFTEEKVHGNIYSGEHEREVLLLVRAYSAINDANLRRKVIDLVRSMSSE